MKARTIILVGILVLAIAAVAAAVPADKTIEFIQSPMGKVIFDGKVHNQAVKSCQECHKTDVFPKMQKGAVTITMQDIYKGKYCGVCHNGTVTFNATENCTRCHKK
jgi:c(7)-type cytochrome triheme protein